MSDEVSQPTISHLYSRPVSNRDTTFIASDWREAVTDESVLLTYGYPYPDSFPYDELQDALDILISTEPEDALQYGGATSARKLDSIIADRLQYRGFSCSAENVVVTNGAMNGIDLVCRTFLDPTDSVLLEAPTFVWTLSVVRNHGVELIGIPVDDEGVDVSEMEQNLRERRRSSAPMPKLFYTIPNFQNPTGVTLSKNRRKYLLELAAEFDFVILEDDAYGELRYDGSDIEPLYLMDDTGRVIHIGSFSKLIGPGIRTGWVIADEAVIERISALHTGGPNVLVKGMIAEYLDSGHLKKAIPNLRDAYRKRRDHVLDCLEKYMPADCTWTEPAGGFFVWVELPEGIDAASMLSAAGREGIVYLPGEMFYPGSTGGENCLRLSFSHVSLPDMDRAIQALATATVQHQQQSTR